MENHKINTQTLAESNQSTETNLSTNCNTTQNENEEIKSNQAPPNAFDRLRKLQLLIKKESSLKQLFIKTREETKNEINEECYQIYRKQLDIYHEIDKKERKKKQNYELIDLRTEKGEILKELNLYIVKLMTYLWEQPKLVANLLANSNIEDVKNYLAPLFGNNFFENILSSSYIEDNLIFVYALLLKQEINDLKNEKEFKSFLENSPCGYLLDQLIKKKDVQSFIYKIIHKVVEGLEILCSTRELNLEISKIMDDLKRKKHKNSKKQIEKIQKRKKTDIYRTSVSANDFSLGLGDDYSETDFNSHARSFKIEKAVIEEKYIRSFNKEEIRKFIESQDKEKKTIFNYICLSEYDKNPSLYNNEKFIYDLMNSDLFMQTQKAYEKNFSLIIEFIERIFASLFNHFHLLPYSIKCLCRILSVLIKKKFPNINIVEQNAFIAKFFFCKLFIPLFQDPGMGALINDFIISHKTLINIKTISKILIHLTSGKLFRTIDKENNYTPFNWYFLEKMPEIIKFFDNLTKVNLPSFIDKFLSEELPDDFELNYFKENSEEMIYHRSMMFTINDIDIIIKNIKNFEEKFFECDKKNGLRKTYNKMNNNSSLAIINEIKAGKIIKINKSDESMTIEKKENNEQTIYYFLLSDLKTNDKFSKLFKIEQKIPNFTLEEIESDLTETEATQNYIIKTKNCVSSLLYNCHPLNKNDFDTEKLNNSIQIFKEVKKYTSSSSYLIDNSIPSQWYINLLMEYLNKIPEELSKNDYQELFNQIEGDINSSIKMLDFEELSLCQDKIKYALRTKFYLDKKKKNIINIGLNEEANNIIEKECIPVEVYFNGNEKLFKIEKANIKEKELKNLDDIVIEDTKKHCLICKTIKIFTNEFPNITKHQAFQDLDLFDLEKELKLPEKLDDYFNLIKENLTKNIPKWQNYFDKIYDKICDYIMEKIYEKIFPFEDPKDDKIFRQTIYLSWIEPKHFIQDKKNYVFDTFLPDITTFFRKLERKKSPRKKFSYMSKIFELIRNLVKVNGGGMITGVDDLMPILNYTFIKARPLRIYSNCKYMELFIGEKKNKKEDNELTQLISLCDYVYYMSYSKLNNVSEEEYDEKCSKAALTESNINNTDKKESK